MNELHSFAHFTIDLCDVCFVFILVQSALYEDDRKRLFALLEALTEVTDSTCLLFQVSTDEQELEVQQTMKSLCPAFPQHRLLFYESAIGKTAILRQMVPSVYIDSDVAFLSKIRPHLKQVIAIAAYQSTPTPAESSALQIRTISCAAELMELIL